jgi:hypothetical protein
MAAAARVSILAAASLSFTWERKTIGGKYIFLALIL